MAKGSTISVALLARPLIQDTQQQLPWSPPLFNIDVLL
jgi:hypothetical protein